MSPFRAKLHKKTRETNTTLLQRARLGAMTRKATKGRTAMRIGKLVFLLLAVVGLSGCTIRMVDFTVISTKNVDVPTASKGTRVTGEDCVLVLVFPFGIPNMKEAIDRTIENAGGNYDALVDGVVYQVNHSFIIGQQCFRVEGTPINTKESVSFRKSDLLRHSQRAG